MPPFAGKGANLAMLDALELSDLLTNNQFSDLNTALSYFEKRMLERGAEALENTLKNADQLHAKDSLEKLLSIFNKKV